MKTPRSRITKAIADRFGKTDSKTLSYELAAYLLSEGRVNDLSPLLRDLMQYRANNGVVEVSAISAHQLTDDVKKDIEDEIRHLYPNAVEVIINEVQDPNVVGGIRIELANQQLDLSVRAKLNKFKQLTVT